MAAQNQGDLFDAYFKRADLDRDGRISGAEAVAFFQGSNLPKQVLAQIWTYADQNRTGYLGKAEFYNALRLVTVAQSKRELTPEIVKAALFSPASAKIPAPQINLASLPAPQSTVAGGTLPTSQMGSLNPGFRGPPPSPNANMNQQYNQSSVGGSVRPPNAVVGSQGFPRGGFPLGSNLANSGGSVPLTTQAGLPSGTPRPVASLPPKPQMTSGMTSLASPVVESRPPVSQNGFASGSLFGGDAFSASPSQLKSDGSVAASSASTLSGSSALDSLPNSLKAQPVGGQLQKMPSLPKQNQPLPAQNIPPSGPPPVPAQNIPPSGPPPVPAQNLPPSGPSALPPNKSSVNQSQLQWPRPTQAALQKYAKVFMEVDTDKDGKITGEQARNLFLSWRLPREVLKQVWDLSDQDNDSMLSLREFCIALYLMERFREGRPLPAVLPSNVLLDFPASQPTGGYGNAAWGYSPGFQQPPAIPGTAVRPPTRPAGKPPLPVPATSSDDRLPPKPQKAKVPVLEKHLVDQLSEEEQKSLNLKFQEASEADKKVEELEKEIKESREKMEFYRVKMQELVLYKSRCDSRLNEVTERAAADKREVESLAKKYEEKYKQVGDVASRLTIEEATFRDIQEKKMEMYQAIVKMEQGGSDENLQVRADHIQCNLEELVKSLSERCKKYGLRGKPTTLLELPFGWQPGIQEGAADWSEDWDKFEDEGFTLVKELTLDVQNVIAPPKTKAKPAKKGKNLAAEGEAAVPNSDTESEHVKPATEDEQAAENGMIGIQKEGGLEKSPVVSPSAKSSHESPHGGYNNNHFGKTVNSDASPRATKAQGDLGSPGTSFSGDKTFDEPSWGTFDINDDVDSVWGSSKEMVLNTHSDDLFGHGEWTLPPIKTSSSQADGFLPKKSIFADSVPGTPADGFLPQKSIFADSVPGTPADGFLPKKSIFADSVPSTPLYGSNYSPQKYSDGPEERGFNFSRFDSFRSTDSGFQPQERLSRFDSIRSTRDFDSQDDGASFQQRETFSRFDSMRSTNDFDYGTRFSSFDDSDPFGSGPFKSSFGTETPRRDSDVFGSAAPFKSSFGSETPRSEVDPFGSVGPFGSSLAGETPRADSDPFGSVGPFRSSLGSETPRRESDYFGYSGSFKSSFGSETPRGGDFDSFGGPFGSSLGSETPRHDSDAFGSGGLFRSSVTSETPKGGTNSWSAF